MTNSQDAQPAASYQQGQFRSPPGALELLLVRHGQSQAYLDGVPFPLVAGQGDPPLSELGHQQSERLAARLAGTGIGAIYVTPLIRTGQTAAPLAALTGLEPRVEAGLREVFLGEWEGGLYRKMMSDGHPTAQQVFEQERWDVIPGAESTESLAARIRAAIGRLAAAHPGQRAAAFTHGGVIAQVVALASGSRPFAFLSADNASITRLVVADGRWVVRGFNDTAHLETLAGTGGGTPGMTWSA